MPPLSAPAPAIDTRPDAGGPRSAFAIHLPDALVARVGAGERAAPEQVYRWFERPAFTLA